jgi:hypothetical protein
MRRTIGAALVFGLGAALLPGAVEPARADTCDTTWAAPADGNFDQPSSWTNGVPTLSRTACLPAFDGTQYTVTVRDNRSAAASLDIAGNVTVLLTDGPSGARFEVAAGIHNAGTIVAQRTHDGTYALVVDSGTLLNEGTVRAQTPLSVSSLDNRAGSLIALADVNVGQLLNLVSGQLTGGLIATQRATVQIPDLVQTLDGMLLLNGELTDATGRPALRQLAQISAHATFAVASATRVVTAARLQTSGHVIVEAGATLEADGGYVQNGGVTENSGGGTLLAPGYGLRNQAGVLSLVAGGHLVGNVVNQGELLVQGSGPVSLIEGTLTEGKRGLLHFTVGTGGLLQVTGTVQLTGRLWAQAVFLGLPTGTTATLLAASSITGTATLVGNDFDVTVADGAITVRRPFIASEDDPAVSYGGWHAARSTLAGDGVVHESQTAGDTATATIQDLAGWDGERRPDGGGADVLANGRLDHHVNTYTTAASALFDRIEAPGAATLTIRVDGTPPPLSTGAWVSVEDARGLATTVDDSDFSYDGWSLVHGASSTYRLSSQPGVPATLVFEGTSVEWLTQTGPDRGRAVVLIDGVSHPVFDLWSRKRKTGVVEGFFGLPPGQHTLQIVPLATANRRSTGTGVVVDGFVAR